MNYLLGIDGGVREVRAVLFDLSGNEIDGVSVDVEVNTDGTACETDMNGYWEAAVSALNLLVNKGDVSADDILGVGITGQSDGLWAVDAEGDPVGSAILGSDRRAVSETAAVLNRTPGMGKLIHRAIGIPVTEGSPMMLLKWLKKNRLSEYNKISGIMLAKDWLRYKLTGRLVTDFTDGVSTILEFPDGRIPGRMLTVLGLGELSDKLPGVLPSDAVAGRVSPEAAALTGLKAGTPVAAGAGAYAAAALGAGAAQNGDMALVTGDVSIAAVVRDARDCDPAKNWQPFQKYIGKDVGLELISTIDLLANIDWALKTFGLEGDYQRVDSMIESTSRGCGGLLFLPYLCAARERELGITRDATGAFFGMTEEAGTAQMIRAVYEACAYSLRDAMADHGIAKRVLMSGNETTDGVFPRIIADCLGVDTIVCRGRAFAARGAAMTAGLAVGVYHDVEDAVHHCCKVAHVYQAKPSSAYEDNYLLYRDLRRALKPLWDRRAQMQNKY